MLCRQLLMATVHRRDHQKERYTACIAIDKLKKYVFTFSVVGKVSKYICQISGDVTKALSIGSVPLGKHMVVVALLAGPILAQVIDIGAEACRVPI